MKKTIGLILFLIPLSISALEITEAELNELESILTEQAKQIEQLQTQLKTAGEQLAKSQEETNALKKSFTEYESETEKIITDLKKKIAAKEREIHGLQVGLGISLGVNVIQGGLSIGLIVRR